MTPARARCAPIVLDVADRAEFWRTPLPSRSIRPGQRGGQQRRRRADRHLDELEYADFDWIVGVNFWGVVHGTKEFLPHLIASGDGHVVNISSLFGLIGVPSQSAYNATKYAVRGFTEAVRQEMLVAGHPVGVTVVHPGGIKTAIARNAWLLREARTSRCRGRCSTRGSPA